MLSRLKAGRSAIVWTLAGLVMVASLSLGVAQPAQASPAGQDRYDCGWTCLGVGWELTDPVDGAMFEAIGRHGVTMLVTQYSSNGLGVPPDPFTMASLAVISVCERDNFDVYLDVTRHTGETYITWDITNHSETFGPFCTGTGDTTLYLGLIKRDWNVVFSEEPTDNPIVLSVGTDEECRFVGTDHRECPIPDSVDPPPPDSSFSLVGTGKEPTGFDSEKDGARWEQDSGSGPGTFGCSTNGSRSCGDYVDLAYSGSGCRFPGSFPAIVIVADERLDQIDSGTAWGGGYPPTIDQLTDYFDGGGSSYFSPALDLADWSKGSGDLTDLEGVARFRLFGYGGVGLGGVDTMYQQGHLYPGGLSTPHRFRMYCWTYETEDASDHCFANFSSGVYSNDPAQVGVMTPVADTMCWHVVGEVSTDGVADFASECGFVVTRPSTWGDPAQCQAVVELRRVQGSLQQISGQLHNVAVHCTAGCSGGTGGGGGGFEDPVNTDACTGFGSIACILRSMADALVGLSDLFVTLFVPTDSTIASLGTLADNFSAHPPGSLMVGSVAGIDTAVTQLSSTGCAELPALDFGTSGPLHGVSVDYPSMCSDGPIASQPMFKAAYDLVRIAIYGLLVFALWRTVAGAFGAKE